MEANTPKQLLKPLQFIQEQICMEVHPETPLEDLGLDSLEMLSLQVECEHQFGKRVSDAQQGQINTVGDLANLFS